MPIYLVKDGIKGVGCLVNNQGDQIFGSNFYLITYDFKTNEGYIEKKGTKYWRLYTQVGQQLGKSRYFKYSDLPECIEKLKTLSSNNELIFC